MDVFVSPVPQNKARKRSRNPEKWKKNKEKQKSTDGAEKSALLGTTQTNQVLVDPTLEGPDVRGTEEDLRREFVPQFGRCFLPVQLKPKRRYAPKALPNIQALKCTHKGEKLHCSKLTPQDIRKFHAAFYLKKEKFYQDAFILKHMKVKMPSQNSSTTTRKRQKSQTHTKLYVKTFTGTGKLVRVCQNFFLKVLDVGVHRLRTIAKKFLKEGKLPVENRGGDRRSQRNVAKKEAVMKFIESLKCIESHYCRSATSTRKYMPSELNIKRLWRMYSEQQENESLKVRHCYFRNIFNTRYNIGFKTPSVDCCSKCLEFKEKIKNEKDDKRKSELIGQLRLHKLKAKSFYEYLRECNEKTLTLSFDCQKNQVLPNVADQAAYYSRQLYQYNFAIVVGNETQSIAPQNVYLYTWTENTHAKSSNEIASAVYHRLCSSDLRNISKIRLMCDGCGSQNKNSNLLTMCGYWLTMKAPPHVTSIEIIFPVPGHSFLPADRVFGLIEKKIKNTGMIILPKQYDEIYKFFGNVIQLGIDCPVSDWKLVRTTVLKDTEKFHFKFSACKRFYIKRVKNNKERFLVRGEINYKINLGASKSLLKNKRIKMSTINPTVIEPNKVKIKKMKMTDVGKLLAKHYGLNWKTEFSELLSFYLRIIEQQDAHEVLDANTITQEDHDAITTHEVGNANTIQEVQDEDSYNDLCQYYPEEIGFSI